MQNTKEPIFLIVP